MLITAQHNTDNGKAQGPFVLGSMYELKMTSNKITGKVSVCNCENIKECAEYADLEDFFHNWTFVIVRKFD
jgi:hypothetical protein